LSANLTGSEHLLKKSCVGLGISSWSGKSEDTFGRSWLHLDNDLGEGLVEDSEFLGGVKEDCISDISSSDKSSIDGLSAECAVSGGEVGALGGVVHSSLAVEAVG